MIKVLIVDDDVHCAEGVKYSIDWEQLGIEEAYTAYSMKQAQKVLLEYEIHIILCDVEMPKGSGLELLQWVEEQGMKPVSILLTSYASFRYAKEAVTLGCMDYLLKPVAGDELTNVLKRAVLCVKDNREKEKYTQLAGYWNDNEKERIRRFWKEILSQEVPLDSIAISKQAEKEHLAFNAQSRYLPVIFKLMHEEMAEKQKSWMDRLTEELEMKSLAVHEQNIVVSGGGRVLVIIEEKGEYDAAWEKLVEKCRKAALRFEKTYHVLVACYIGKFMESGSLAPQYKQLCELDADNVAEYAGVYILGEEPPLITYRRPDIENWISFFREGNYDDSYREIMEYVESLVCDRQVNKEVLEHLLQDLMQAFYIVLGEKEIQAHLLFQGEEATELYQNAVCSVRNFKKWMKHMIAKAITYVKLAANTNSVVNKTEIYIKQHLGEELGRVNLAKHVFLSPDYLSRIFRQEKGISLSEYITDERMKKAKQLLRETDMSVSDIAYQVGYSNLTYFIRVFRERNQVTPVQFREHNHILRTK